MAKKYINPQVTEDALKLCALCITGSDGTSQILDDGGNTSDLGDEDLIIATKFREGGILDENNGWEDGLW